MKKIIFIINNLGIGGAERVLVDDINELVRRGGIDIRLITLRDDTENTFMRELLLDRSLWKKIVVKNILDIFNFFKIVKFIHDEKPDAIVSHLWYANTIAKIYGLFMRFRNIVTFEQNVYDSIKSKKSFFLDRFLQKFSRKIIAVSVSVKKSLVSHGIDRAKIELVYNSVPVEKFLTQQILVSPIPEVSGKTKFLFVGRLIPQKNVDLLITSFEKVREGVLYIVGKGYLEQRLKALVQEKKLEDRIFFLGTREDIPALMQFCDCFILPSKYEGFSLVLIEAMAAGKPIIVTDFSAGKEVVVHQKNGIVVPQTEGGIAEGCLLLINDKGIRERIALEARSTAENFSIEKHVDRLLEILWDF